MKFNIGWHSSESALFAKIKSIFLDINIYHFILTLYFDRQLPGEGPTDVEDAPTSAR